MEGWQDDKRWSDRFLPEIKGILGTYLIGEAPEAEDQQRNTDLIVLRMEAVRIACRVRRFDAFTRWPNDFTIRASRPSGAETELTKIVSGWGDYLFYGFSDKDEIALSAWFLGDLSVFRLWLLRSLARDKEIPGRRFRNKDGSSELQAFRLQSLPDSFIVAESGAGLQAGQHG